MGHASVAGAGAAADSCLVSETLHEIAILESLQSIRSKRKDMLQKELEVFQEALDKVTAAFQAFLLTHIHR